MHMYQEKDLIQKSESGPKNKYRILLQFYSQSSRTAFTYIHLKLFLEVNSLWENTECNDTV